MSVLSRFRRTHEPATRIAHIELSCPHCKQTTDAYIVENMEERVDVRCLRCREVFEFGPGMLYKPVAYVTVVPSGAEFAK
jgi:phage FluMu protein Com